MHPFIRPALFVASLCLLSACEPNVQDYVDSAKLREEKLRECADMGVMAAKEDKFCQMAMEAQGIVIKQAAGNLFNAVTMQQSDEDDAPEERKK